MNKKNTKNILVIGNFDILHPGHIRLLKFAKECGESLTVAINNDSSMNFKNRVDENHRLEMVKSLEYVDNAFLTNLSPSDLVSQIMPYAVVKGKEHENEQNSEIVALKKYGGKLIFGSGEFESSAAQFIKNETPISKNFNYAELLEYCNRHKISQNDIEQALYKIQSLNVLVIGEVIVDEYVQGAAVGLSQEDPTIVMTPSKKRTYLGGAAITAGHIKSIGANSVTLMSVLGEDETALHVKKNIVDYQLESIFFSDESRPTPLKTRFRAGSKTLLRVNQVRQHKISIELQDKLFKKIKERISKIDLLVFSDFNYGILPQQLVDKISKLCKKFEVKVVADSQTSSQVGDISRYNEMHLITPTEREVRVALNNPDDGLVTLANKLTQKSKPKLTVITLAEEGVFIHIPTNNFKSWENDKLPAINQNAIDPAGAGDCFLAASALALAANASPWIAFYLGSFAAACQVSYVGNKPLQLSTLRKAISESFS